MDQKTLTKLLGHAAFTGESKTRFIVNESFDVAVLLATQTASSIRKVQSLDLSDGACTLTTAESTYLLPLSGIFGIRIDADKSSNSGRTGFLA